MEKRTETPVQRFCRLRIELEELRSDLNAMSAEVQQILCVQIPTILSLVLVLPVNSVNSARNNDIVIKICRHDHISILYFSYFFDQMLLYAIDAVSFLHFTMFHHRSSFHNFN